MQFKDIMILAKSRKFGNYCIAGYDVESGKWVRVISSNKAAHFSTPHRDIMLKGLYREAAVLDVVRISMQKVEPTIDNPHQIENWNYNANEQWELVKTIEYKDVPKSLLYKGNYLFYNTKRLLNKADMQCVTSGFHSIVLIEPSFFEFYLCEFEDTIKFYANIKYNGIVYRKIALTDPIYEHQATELYKQNKQSIFFVSYNPYLVISLGGVFEQDLCYYKLIASILTNPKAKLCAKTALVYKAFPAKSASHDKDRIIPF